MTKEKVFKVIKIILLIIAIIFVGIFVKKIINKEEIPFITKTNAYIVLSGSMEPAINIGDIVVITEAKQEEINEGDIISFTKGTMMVTHRVTEITEENGVIMYKTKGDNNNAEDLGVITYDNVAGKYNFKIPKLGHVVLFIQDNIVAVISVFIFVAVFILTKPQNEEEK